MACRRIQEANQCIKRIKNEQPKAMIEAMYLDLGSLISIRCFADEFKRKENALHGLINNAGIMNAPYKNTTDGFEMHLGVNHLGHVLLTELLLDILMSSAPSRVICVSSCAHDKVEGRTGAIHFEDLNYTWRKYDGWEAYAQSKLANVLYAKILAKRLATSRVTAVSIHPGWVPTELTRNTRRLWLRERLLQFLLRRAGMITPWEGIQTTLYALLGSNVQRHSGAYYSQTGFYRIESCNTGGWPLESPNPIAHSDETADRLWLVSQDMLKLA
jgi:NAD(P)-dependent dehydrogenase (short-subunit alcohol dehydrogenase family)